MARASQGWAVGLVGLVFLQLSLFSSPTVEAAGCFKSVFAFGDGLFDTGSISAIFPSLLNYDYPPYGSTFFGKPSGRMSDGRLVLDFLTDALGVPKLPSYAQTVSSDFSKGISFGSAFSTIGEVKTGQTAGPFMFLNPFSIPMQVAQYVEFQSTTSLIHAGKLVPNTPPHTKRALLEEDEETVGATEATQIEEVAHARARLPSNAEFSSGLYMVSSGAHDFINMFNQNFTIEHMEGTFGKLMTLYGLAIRSFAKFHQVKDILVFDVEPLGCQPFLLTLLPHTDEDLDAKGCLIKVNALIQKFNKQLRSSVKNWRQQYKANIVYVSQYDIKITLINDAESGFNSTNVACCGVPTSPYNVNILVPCGPPGFDITTNTPYQATSCSSPGSHLYWDGFYTTEAANKYVAEKILSGDYFDIPFETLTSCATTPLS